MMMKKLMTGLRMVEVDVVFVDFNDFYPHMATGHTVSFKLRCK